MSPPLRRSRNVASKKLTPSVGFAGAVAPGTPTGRPSDGSARTHALATGATPECRRRLPRSDTSSPLLPFTPPELDANLDKGFDEAGDSILAGIDVDFLEKAAEAAGGSQPARTHWASRRRAASTTGDNYRHSAGGASSSSPILFDSSPPPPQHSHTEAVLSVDSRQTEFVSAAAALSASVFAPPASAGSRAGSSTSMASRARRKLRENAIRRLTVSQRLAREAERAAAEESRAAAECAQRALQQEEARARAAAAAAEAAAAAATAATDSFYGLPRSVQQLLKHHRGIEKLYDWQDECLRLDAVQKRQNLIYALPTSGGKTLVAELLALRELLLNNKDVLFILPFVAIVQEKVKSLSAFALDLGFLVEEYAGSKGTFPPRQRRKYRSLYIATIEKASSLVNSLLELGRISQLGLVVVDELHMIGEGGSRGATLEMTLAKLLHCSAETQIVGMSATISNIDDLRTFLRAAVYTNNFRPVALEEYVKIEGNIFRVAPGAVDMEEKLSHDRFVHFPYTKYMSSTDPDHLLGLVSEVIPEYSCLIFCPTKKNCENVVELLSSMMDATLTEVKKTERCRLLTELRDNCSRVCRILARTIRYGLAYHHSGLTTDERRLIEEAYADGTLCLLACTSTLAAGVNLPAKRVIVRSPYVGMQVMTSSQYKQMVGRAGRAGIDSTGESILIVQPRDRAKLANILCGAAECCNSSLLYDDGKGFRRFILSLIGLKLCNDREALLRAVGCTLLAVQAARLCIGDIAAATDAALHQLIDRQLVTEKKPRLDHASRLRDSDPIDEAQLNVTELGRAACKGAVDVEISQQLYKDLCKAQESLCLANYLHLLYLVTPYDMVDQVNPSWELYLKSFNQLSSTEQKVATIIGVEEAHLVRRVSGQKPRKDVDEFVVKRFYVTLMLYSLWQKNSVWSVADRFQQDRGKVQNLLHSASSFAACVHHFSQELQELWAYHELFAAFVKKLSYCTSVELLPLMDIPGIKIARARQLYNFGLKTLQHVAHCDPEILVRNIEHLPRKHAREIVSSAMMLLRERAETLREEAEEIARNPSDAPT